VRLVQRISREGGGSFGRYRLVPRPGGFKLSSLESRTAARVRLATMGDEGFSADHESVMSGFPWTWQPPVIFPPDSIAYYEVTDGSVMEVIRREYEPGKFTAIFAQVWPDGAEYSRGPSTIYGLAELRQSATRIPPSRYLDFAALKVRSEP
jgi:hypothetical protein